MVITFPVSNRKKETLLPLIKRHTKKGSYIIQMIILLTQQSLLGKHNSIAHKNEEYVREDTLTLMELKVSGVMQRCGCIIIGAYLKIIFISI